MRTGWDSDNLTAVELAKRCENAGASMLTVHGRTRVQMYAPGIDFNTIKAVKNAVEIPVVANGDIVDGKSAKNMLDYTGCDALMIGRAAQGNPWSFEEILHYLNTGESLHPPSVTERIEVMLRHLELLIEYKGERIGVLEARKHMAWYIKGIRNGPAIREMINKASSEDDMKNIIFSIQKYMNSL
jgi:nifR3 family TIM-barrel protein